MVSTIFDCSVCGTTVNVDLSEPGLVQCPCCGVDLKTGQPVVTRPTNPTTIKCWACGMNVPANGHLCPYCKRYKHRLSWVTFAVATLAIATLLIVLLWAGRG